MNKYKEEKIFEAPTEYAQYWRCTCNYEEGKGYTVKYITASNSSNSYRGIFTSDRDRVMYTTCFLRLASKTQIFRVGNNDHLRTRLTHTLEVSQIARTIARELGANVDLVEAIALGHDVGHTPFGHAGERQLNEISQNMLEYLKVKKLFCDKIPLENFNGFKHNQQSVRVLVDYSHDISLTNFCLYGIRNHSSLVYNNCSNTNSMAFYNQYNKYCSYQDNHTLNLYPSWSLEAVIVHWADEIAQRHHDIEDAYRCRLITKEEIIELLGDLMKYFDYIEELKSNSEYDNYCEREHFDAKLKSIKDNINDKNKFSKNLSSIVVDFYVSALIREMLYALDELSARNDEINTPRDFANKYLKIQEDEIWELFKLESGKAHAFAEVNKSFEKELKNIIMPSYDVQRQDGKGSFITRKLLNAYITNPQQLPDEYIKRVFNIEIPIHLNGEQLNIVHACLGGFFEKDFGKWDIAVCRNALNKLSTAPEAASAYAIIYPLLFRVIFDYISGMTDLFALEEYKQLY